MSASEPNLQKKAYSGFMFHGCDIWFCSTFRPDLELEPDSEKQLDIWTTGILLGILLDLRVGTLLEEEEELELQPDIWHIARLRLFL